MQDQSVIYLINLYLQLVFRSDVPPGRRGPSDVWERRRSVSSEGLRHHTRWESVGDVDGDCNVGVAGDYVLCVREDSKVSHYIINKIQTGDQTR